MEQSAADSQVVDMPTDAQMGGKKRRQNKNKKGGAGVETVLAPAVLYGLRRMVTPGGKRKQRGGDAFSSQASPVGESSGPLLAVVPVVPPAGVAVVPPSGDMLPKEAVAVATDSGDKPLEGGAKKGKKGKKGPMATGRMGVKGKLGPLGVSTGVYGQVKAWGGDDNNNDDQQDGGKKKRKAKKGGDKDDDKKDNNNDNQQDGGKKKRKSKSKKGGDKDDDKKDNKNDNNNDNDNQQDGGKKKRRSKKLKGGALDLYAQQLEQISNSLNKLLFN